MLERWTLFSRRLALPLTAGLLAIAGPMGCSSAEPDDGVLEGPATNVNISSQDLDDLGPGKSLSIDLSSSNVLYHFLYDKPLDWKRINLTFGNGAEVSMDSAMAPLFSHPYSPLEATTKRFVITSDAANFTDLSDTDLEALKTEGMLMRENGSGGPQAQPQSVDDCVEQTTYSTVTVTIDGTTYEFPCAHTTLVCGGTPACSEVQTFGGHNYLFCNNQETWETARSYCQDFGMRLLSINDSIEENWVYHVANGISSQKWWMGLNDRASEGQFAWDGGDAVGYTNWYAGEPNNVGNEDCGQLNRFYPNFGWNDEPCYLHLRHVCESD